jgi:hypothetical protein
MPNPLLGRIRAAGLNEPLDLTAVEDAEATLDTVSKSKPASSSSIPSWLKALLGAGPAANIADIITTEQALNRGGVEGNPLMASKWARWGLKPMLSAGTTYGAYKLAKQGKIKQAALLAALSTIPPALAALHNSNVNR